MKNILTLFFLLLCSMFKAQGYITCEEYKECYFRHNISGTSKQIKTVLWKTNIYVVSVCNFGDLCSTYPNFRDYATPGVIKQDNIVSMTLSNINRKRLKSHGDVWIAIAYFSDGSSEMIFETTLIVIAKPKQLTCTYNTSVYGLLIECMGSKSFPESKCNFSLKFNNVVVEINGTPEYNHTKFFEDDEYFKTACSLNISTEYILTGYLELDVKIYPNTSNTEWDDCGSRTIIMYLEYPKVELKNCSNYAVEGTRLDCTCIKSDKSDLPGKISWYHEEEVLELGYNMSVLTSTVSKTLTYVCKSQSAFGWSSNNETYMPNVIYADYLNISRCKDDKPYLCLPFGNCYGNDEFCSDGQVQSCFPSTILNNGTDLKTWCVTDGPLRTAYLRGGSCRFACSKHFGFLEQNFVEDNTSTFFILIPVLILLILMVVSLWSFNTVKGYLRKRVINSDTEMNVNGATPLPTPKQETSTTEEVCERCRCLDKKEQSKYIKFSAFKERPDTYLDTPNYEILKCICAYALLTVKIKVKQISTKRLLGKEIKEKDFKYALGTGVIVDIKCAYKEDEKSYWRIFISTSKNLVCDDEEALTVIVEFDDRNLKFYGSRVDESSIDGHSCIIECFCKDYDHQLDDAVLELKEYSSKLLVLEDKAVIILYPHGLEKCIRIIDLKNIQISETNQLNLSGYLINNYSCPGYDGALLLLMNDYTNNLIQKMFLENLTPKEKIKDKKLSEFSKEYPSTSKSVTIEELGIQLKPYAMLLGPNDDIESSSTEKDLLIDGSKSDRAQVSDRNHLKPNLSVMYDCIKSYTDLIKAITYFANLTEKSKILSGSVAHYTNKKQLYRKEQIVSIIKRSWSKQEGLYSETQVLVWIISL